MRILQLCNKSPLPPKEGGPIAMYHLAKALISAGHQVDVLAVSTPKFSPDNQTIENHTDKLYNIETEFINTNISVKGAFMAFLKAKPYHVERFISQRFSEKLLQKVKQHQYDLVIFETLYMAPYLRVVRENSNAVCVLRSHNIEHQIWKRVAFNEKNPLKRKYIQYLADKLRTYENSKIPEFDAVACISNYEKQYYHLIAPDTASEVVPFGIQIPETPLQGYEGSGFYHMGSMDWMPNIEGIKWLLKYVVPVIEKNAPEIRVNLAGRNMPAWVYENKSPVLNVIGEVDDAAKFIGSQSVLLVPLLSGSGIRIKIIEAMSMGKAVISTTTGAEGIHVIHEENIFLADDPQSFAEAIIYLYTHPEKVYSTGKKGRELMMKNHNYQAAVASFDKLLQLISVNQNNDQSIHANRNLQ